MRPEELKTHFEVLLKADEDKDKASEHLNAVYSELKSKGYDVAALKKIVTDLKKGMEKVLQMETMVELYRENLGLKE